MEMEVPKTPLLFMKVFELPQVTYLPKRSPISVVWCLSQRHSGVLSCRGLFTPVPECDFHCYLGHKMCAWVLLAAGYLVLDYLQAPRRPFCTSPPSHWLLLRPPYIHTTSRCSGQTLPVLDQKFCIIFFVCLNN